MLRFPHFLGASALGLALLAPPAATAGDPPKPPPGAKPEEKPAEPVATEPEYKGPEIRWATSFTDAMEEAAQRNVPIYLHSHGST